MASGEMDGAEFTGFLSEAFRNLVAFSGDGALHFICMDSAPPITRGCFSVAPKITIRRRDRRDPA